VIATVPRQLPFEMSEFQGRLNRVETMVAERKFDAICLFDPRHVFYLTGSDSQGQGHLQALIVRPGAQLTYITWDFEAGKVATSSWLADPKAIRWDYEQAHLAADCWVADVVTYSWFDDPVAVLAQTLSRLQLAKATIGVELHSTGLSAASFDRLRDALPEARFEPAYGILEHCRRQKSAAELTHIRAAAELTDKAVTAAYAAMRVGGTDSDVAAAIIASLYANGSEPLCWGPIVAAGPNAGIGHSSFVGRKLEKGDTVFLEFTGQVNRYVAPVMRTAVLGPASRELKEWRDCGLKAIDAILSMAKPGVPASAVALAGKAALEPIADRVHFHDMYGYMVGIGYPPSWYETLSFELEAGNQGLLEEGMVFHAPISLRRFADFGVGQSQTIVITRDGAESVTRSPAALQEV